MGSLAGPSSLYLSLPVSDRGTVAAAPRTRRTWPPRGGTLIRKQAPGRQLSLHPQGARLFQKLQWGPCPRPGAWVDLRMGSREVAGTRGPVGHTLGPFLWGLTGSGQSGARLQSRTDPSPPSGSGSQGVGRFQGIMPGCAPNKRQLSGLRGLLLLAAAYPERLGASRPHSTHAAGHRHARVRST